MAWLAVNGNGDETISPEKPERGWGKQWDFSEEVCVESECGSVIFTISLPKGSVYKLIGRELTWNDEPEELSGVKSIFCTMVLRLMDTEGYGCNYCKSLALVLELFPEVDRELLEKELDKYI